LEELYIFVGFGKNGRMTPNRGWVRSSLATRAIEYSSMHPPQLQSVAAKKPAFGTTASLRGSPPDIWRLTCSVRRKNRTVRQELQNNTWIRALMGKITTATHIEEFVSL